MLQLPRLSRTMKALLSSPLIVALFAATRLIVICDYNISAATKLAATGGVIGTLVGTVVPLVPLYLPLVTIAFLLVQKWLLVIAAALATALVSPAYTNVAMAYQQAWSIGAPFVRAALNRQWKQLWSQLWHSDAELAWCLAIAAALAVYAVVRTRLHSTINSCLLEGFLLIVKAIFSLIVGIAVMLGAAAVLLFAQQIYRFPIDAPHAWQALARPWLPAEQIRLHSGEKIVGYVLATNDGWITVLRDNDRLIIYYHTTDVESRTMCSTNPASERTPLPVLHPPAAHVGIAPPCTAS